MNIFDARHAFPDALSRRNSLHRVLAAMGTKQRRIDGWTSYTFPNSEGASVQHCNLTHLAARLATSVVMDLVSLPAAIGASDGLRSLAPGPACTGCAASPTLLLTVLFPGAVAFLSSCAT
jgi:hypothetical protein